MAKISYSSYPHIIETVLTFSDYATLLRLRLVCSDLKAKADRALCDGKLEVELSSSFSNDHVPSATPGGRPCNSKPVVVLRSGLGVLPFLNEEERAMAFSLGHTVHVDGVCLSYPAKSDRLATPVSDPVLHPLQASLCQSMQSLPPSAKVAIAHDYWHGPPLFLPQTSHLVFNSDAHCECRMYYRGPSHSASHVTLHMTAGQRPSPSRSRLSTYCQLIVLALQPTVQRITMSANSADDLESALVLLGGLRMDFAQSGREEPSEDLELEIQLRERGGFVDWAGRLGLAPEKVHVTYSSDDTE